MPRKKLMENFAEDESWFQAQPEMIPWEQGQETLEKIVDCILAKNREELFGKLIRRNHRDRPTYFHRLCHCLRYHWEKAKNDQPRCNVLDVVKEIYIKYGQRNVFDSVVLAVAVVFKEGKALIAFRLFYEKTFQSVANRKLPGDGNHDECREHVFGELIGNITLDKQERVKNARLNDYGGTGSFTRWLRQAIDRRIASYFNLPDMKNETLTSDMPAHSRERPPAYEAETREETTKLRRVMNQWLTRDEVMMFRDHYEHHLTLDEICAMNISLKKQPTDKGNLSKKLKEIRDKIKNHWDI